jgi:membrane protease YdiL (CAAX protease family)
LRDQISYTNAWILRVDGAGRRASSWVVLGVAVAALLLAMFGGVTLYGRLAAPLADRPALDRIVLDLCILGPLYAVALVALAYERRAREPANAAPAAALALGGSAGFLGFTLAVGLAALLHAVAPGAAPAALAHRLSGLVLGVAVIAFQAFGEELFFRGWIQPVLAARWGPWIGLTATSVLFAAAHALGRPPGVLALVNDALAGAVFGLLAYRSGGLLAPFAAHFAWNWAEQSVFGLTPNPGVDALGSLLDLDLVGPRLLSGGADEMNGAITATLALLAMAGLALAWTPGARAATTAGAQASKAS